MLSIDTCAGASARSFQQLTATRVIHPSFAPFLVVLGAASARDAPGTLFEKKALRVDLWLAEPAPAGQPYVGLKTSEMHQKKLRKKAHDPKSTPVAAPPVHDPSNNTISPFTAATSSSSASADADAVAKPRTLQRALSHSPPSRSAQPAPSHAWSPTLPSLSFNPTSTGSSGLDPAAAALHHHYHAPAVLHEHPSRFSVTQKTSSDLLGQRFDADVLNNHLNAVSYEADYTTAQQQPLSQQPSPHIPQQPSEPIQLPLSRPSSHTHSPAIANPAVRLSQSLAATGRRMDDLTASRGEPSGMRSPRQRYSDESGKESKFLKKKSGFSSMISSLVGTPRKPTISAPENPVHVTHVGYDQETGEFTVSIYPLFHISIKRPCL